MKIGIMSDSHDRIDNVAKAMKVFDKEGVGAIIHCGDLCAPFMIDELAEFKEEIYVIAGNICDEKRTCEICSEKGVNFYGEVAELDIDDRKIGVVHVPELAESMALSQKYDVVFFGHTHSPSVKRAGKTLLANPGELMGRNGIVSVGIYNTEDNSIKHMELR